MPNFVLSIGFPLGLSLTHRAEQQRLRQTAILQPLHASHAAAPRDPNAFVERELSCDSASAPVAVIPEFRDSEISGTQETAHSVRTACGLGSGSRADARGRHDRRAFA